MNGFRLTRLLLALALLLPMTLVSAAPQAVANPAHADAGKALSDEAAALFKEGKFMQAAELFERAFALNPEKLVRLRNAGRAYEEAGKLDYARLLFERYLNQAPDGPDKDEVRLRIEHIDHVAAAAKKAEEPPPAKLPGADAKPVDPVSHAVDTKPEGTIAAPVENGGPRWAAWAVAAVGVGAAVGGMLWVGQVNAANSRVVTGWAEGKYDYPGGSKDYEDNVNTVGKQRNLAWTTAGIGAAAALGGAVWAMWPTQATKIAVVPTISTELGFAVCGQF